MEITARPRRRGFWRALRGVLVVVALLCVALLVPAAIGLQTHVVGDEAMAGTHSRGSLVFGERVTLGQLVVGDVVTFPSPEGGGELLTRRVVSISDEGLHTRGDATGAADPWLVDPMDAERVVFSLPFLGYPLLAVDAMSVPPWAPAVLVLGLAALLVLLRRTARAVDAAPVEAGIPERVRPTPTTPSV